MSSEYSVYKKVYVTVCKAVAETLGEDVAALTQSTNLYDDLRANFLDVVEVVMALEKEYNMEISDEDAESLATIGDIVNYVVLRIKQSEKRSDVYKTVCKVLTEVIPCDRTITGQTSLFDDLDISVYLLHALAQTLEAEFDIEIPVDDATKWRTVNDIIAYIEKSI